MSNGEIETVELEPQVLDGQQQTEQPMFNAKAHLLTIGCAVLHF